MGRVVVHWDMKALGHVIGTSPSVVEVVERSVNEIADAANSLAEPSPAGHEAPSYGCDVEMQDHCAVGLAYTTNYEAMVDNTKNNTLLKAMGHAGAGR